MFLTMVSRLQTPMPPVAPRFILPRIPVPNAYSMSEKMKLIGLGKRRLEHGQTSLPRVWGYLLPPDFPEVYRRGPRGARIGFRVVPRYYV